METQHHFFVLISQEVEDIIGMEISRIKVAFTLGDTKLDLEEDFPSPIWLISIIKQLTFNPYEWKWLSKAKEMPFFKHTSKINYLLGMFGRKQESRLQEKMKALKLIESEIQASIILVQDINKPVKLQYFTWQVASSHAIGQHT